ncbi:MAG TPA: S8 family serine peptidase [Chitinophagales bacterium]|nr:S8 family serine peptidase [Chitinophagales bacterium]
MRSKIKFLLLLLLTAQYGFSQQAKLNPSLWREIMKQPVSSRVVSLLVQGDPGIVEQKIKLLGGTFKFSLNNISSVSLPLDEVITLAQTQGISRVEGLYGNGRTMDEVTNVNANVNPVHDGIAPLTQGYDGSGVVMGFLDDGIDYHHPDFQNADGTTRIKYIWDQNANSGGDTPQPYNYGQEWNASVINSGTCSYYETNSEFGHGSNVAGIGAGNGLAVNNYEGVAPKSDIIAVAIAFDENFLFNVVDATEYCFHLSDSLFGEPCVVNASLGTYYGSHDGYDLPAQMIDALLEQQSGRSFICAGGNAGNAVVPFHLGYSATSDSSFTWLKYNPSLHEVFYEWWVDKDVAPGFNFAIGADSINPYIFLGRTKYYNLVNDFNYINDTAVKKDTLFSNGKRIGIITFTAYRYDSTYACDVAIKPGFTTDYWRFITGGTGRFDLWSHSGLIGTSDMVTAVSLPDTFQDIVRYIPADSSQTIVSSFSCSDKVITVANYTNRDNYIDYYEHLETFINPPGALARGSSVGPTRDGRMKPDITAPGDVTLASGLILGMDNYGYLVYEMALFIYYQSFKVAQGGMHLRNGGTSMASPVVAGVAALYLQKNPTADWKEIKDAIRLSAIQDNYTGYNLPDSAWGYGKINAFGALTTTIIYGCTNPMSLNFNPQATVDDGSCEFNIGIDDPSQAISFSCFPNPASSFTTFFFNLNEEGNADAKILITDVQGKILDELKISSQQHYLTYRSQLPAGLYFCRLQSGNGSSRIIKLLVQE